MCHRNNNCDIIWKEPKPTHCKAWVQKSRHQVAVAETPNISGFLVWKLRQIIILEPRILRWLLDFWKACEPLLQDTSLVFPEETEENH